MYLEAGLQMTQYVVKRILILIPVMLGVILILFALMYNLIGSSMQDMSISGGGDALDSFFSFFNIEGNFFSRYLRYCYNLFVRFEFGKSRNGLPVIDFLPMRIQLTALLTLLSSAITFLIGIPLGIYSAMRKNRWQDNSLTFLTMLLSSIPNYCLAFILCFCFVLRLKLLPTWGFSSPKHFVLPIATLSVAGIASLTRITRASMLEVFDESYITALRSKGLKERLVIFRHALKNAMVPVLSVFGAIVSQLLCGSIVVETYFAIPGLGVYMLSAVSGRDHFSLLGCAVIITLALLLVNLFSDIAYALVNPQIKQRYSTRADRKGA